MVEDDKPDRKKTGRRRSRRTDTYPERNARLLKRIDERLDALALSDRAASLRAGLHENTIRSVRRGYAPKVRTLMALAPVLECSPAELLELADAVAPDPQVPLNPDLLDRVLTEVIAQMQAKGYELVPSVIVHATTVVYEQVIPYAGAADDHLPTVVGTALAYERKIDRDRS